MIQSATMQLEGGGGQFCDLVEVTVGQYGCADVVMVTLRVLTVVIVLMLLVTYVVGVGVQMAGEAVRRADPLENRANRLERDQISSRVFRKARWLKMYLGYTVWNLIIPQGQAHLGSRIHPLSRDWNSTLQYT